MSEREGMKSPDEGSYLVDLEGGVLRLSFNRPTYGNAVPPEAVPRLTALFTEAQADPSVRCILVRGEGRIFSAGGDVAGFRRSLEQDAPTRRADFAARLPRLRTLVEAVLAFDRPIVASIRGAAAGAGLLYPLAADLVIGDDSATFAFVHQGIGLSPDGGVTALLPQVVGVRTARMLLLTMAKLDATEAHRVGILHRIVAAEMLEEEAMKAARRFARAPQQAIVLAKRLVNASAENGLADQLDLETAGILDCVVDPDFAEGVAAFLDKRPAAFPSAR